MNPSTLLAVLTLSVLLLTPPSSGTTEAPPESRQRPNSNRVPSWSNPPTVPWVDDPPGAEGGAVAGLLPILYLLAPLVVTAMLMPVGATLITALVMMNHRANGQRPQLGIRALERGVLELMEALAKYAQP